MLCSLFLCERLGRKAFARLQWQLPPPDVASVTDEQKPSWTAAPGPTELSGASRARITSFQGKMPFRTP